eukprot:GHUV01033294.1.p1 GENE.GHUV01033294.1~~GHUV01033294.1.p1  ORF type:complete len:128 (+),score=34.71 GHUV01033294.1:129-512(+)
MQEAARPQSGTGKFDRGSSCGFLQLDMQFSILHNHPAAERAYLLQCCFENGAIRAAQAWVCTDWQHATILHALPGNKVTSALPLQAVGGQTRYHHLQHHREPSVRCIWGTKTFPPCVAATAAAATAC